MKMPPFRLFFFLFILPLYSISQEYSYINYNSKEGLAGSTVYCIQQDKEGFLWFGTETGLSRFDGTHFRNFTTADGLPDNEILRLFVDSRNRVWIIPFKNSFCYYWRGKIYNEQNDSLLKKVKIDGEVRSIHEDREGNILIKGDYSYAMIMREGTVRIISEVNGQLFRVIEAGLSDKGIFRLTLNVNESGIIFIDQYSDRIENLKRDKRLYATPTFYSYLITPGLEAIRRPDSILFYRTKRDEISGIPLPENFIDMAVLNDSIFVINAAGKCLLYDVNQKKIIRELLDGHKVTTVLEDGEKNLWFATLGEGIFRLASTEFRNVRFSDNKSSLSVFSIHKSDSTLYIGTDHLLIWKFDKNKGTISKHMIRKGIPQQGRVTCLESGTGKNLLIGSDLGVFRYTGSKMNGLLNGAIKSLVFDNNKLFIASAEGVFQAQAALLVTTEEGVLRKENDYGRIDSIHVWGKRATCAFPHNDGIYIGTLNGLYELTPKELVFLGQKTKLLSNRISAITKTEDDIFWFATYGEGIVAYKDGNVIMNINKQKGLSSDICRNIFVAGNNLWVGTDKGLNKIALHGSHYEITTFTVADGLGADIINAVCVDEGIVYVGTPQGLTYFDENKVSRNADCALRITEISSSEHAWDFDTTNFLLPHRNNNIRFEFVGISYKSAGDIIYKYRLVGLDTNWKTTHETFLSYPSLPSGNYELQLIAINKSGVQSDVRQIRFEIEELLQEKTWFKVMALLIAAALIWLIVSLYILGIRRKEADKANTLRKMAELEQMALKAQMNPHFIFNSLNSIQHYVMEKDIAGANRFITGFSSLMRQTLDFSSKQEVSLKEELQYLSTYLELERIRLENKFVYEIRVGNAITENEYHIPPMILQPFVENSIRHGIGYRKDKLGKIIIGVDLQAEKLVCIIEDNGVGRLVAGQFKNIDPILHQSKGMSLTADRIAMFNQHNKNPIEMGIYDLIDEQGNPLGTRVKISFPV